PTLHEDTALLDLASGVLGSGRASRLYRAVRERQLAASVSAYNYTPTDVGVFVVHAEMPAATVAQGSGAVWHQLRAMRDEGITVQETTRAQRVFDSRWLRHLESMEGQATHLTEWEALGDWQLGDRYYERIMSATPRAVTDAVQRYLTPDRAGWVVYLPATSPTIADGADAARGLLDAEHVPALAPLAGVAETPAPATLARLDLEREEGGVRIYRTGTG